MFRFFKRKKSSDDNITESPSPSDLQEDAASASDALSVSSDELPPEARDLASESAPLVVEEAAEPVPAHPDDSSEPASETLEVSPELEEHARVPEVVETVETVESVELSEPTEPVEPMGSSDAGTPVETLQNTSASTQVSEQPKGNDKSGSWFARLKKGLSRTGQSIGGLFVDVTLDEDLYEELETALIMADAGMDATTQLLDALRERVRKERLTDAMQARVALRDLLTDHLRPLEKPFPLGSVTPLVMMIAGVNGAGKTTSIGKLANTFQASGAHVLLAAGDTFRAAAREQLMEWGVRNNVTVIAQDGGDPAAVAFDAVNAGRARKADVVMIDTAGRLPTQLHLMEELKKIKRVVSKAEGSAPHEVLLVVDGNSGQNVLAQIRAFDAAIGLTGLVVTKLDGTAKGGILAAVAAGSQGVRPVPVYWIGVGEGIHDLQPFKAHEFAAALIGDPAHTETAS